MVTDSQVRRLKRLSKTEETKEVAAAKAGMDPKTARKYLQSGMMPSEGRRDREWRTRPDPFADVWDELKAEKECNPGLEAKTLFEEMQRRYPGRFADGQLRTLERKFKEWRATVRRSRFTWLYYFLYSCSLLEKRMKRRLRRIVASILLCLG